MRELIVLALSDLSHCYKLKAFGHYSIILGEQRGGGASQTRGEGIGHPGITSVAGK